jgi:hypothetical protein
MNQSMCFLLNKRNETDPSLKLILTGNDRMQECRVENILETAKYATLITLQTILRLKTSY